MTNEKLNKELREYVANRNLTNGANDSAFAYFVTKHIDQITEALVLPKKEPPPWEGLAQRAADDASQQLATTIEIEAMSDFKLGTVNHDEAKLLAAMHRKESNLARCYLDLVGKKQTPFPDPKRLAELKLYARMNVLSEYDVNELFFALEPSISEETLQHMFAMLKKGGHIADERTRI